MRNIKDEGGTNQLEDKTDKALEEKDLWLFGIGQTELGSD
jgi:hypothetical protein